MGSWVDEIESEYSDKDPYIKCSDCGETHEVSTKYINSLTDEIVNICYNCHKKKYIEGLVVMSAIDGFSDI
tara:strand:- start:503 stop:715 length:213 start_codon:yes stop_codon:yes gene_type:complete